LGLQVRTVREFRTTDSNSCGGAESWHAGLVGKCLLEQLAEFHPGAVCLDSLCTASPNRQHSSLASLSLEKQPRARHDNGKTASFKISCINISHDWALPIDPDSSPGDFGRQIIGAHAGIQEVG